MNNNFEKDLQHFKMFSACFGLVTIHHQDIQYINLQENIVKQLKNH